MPRRDIILGQQYLPDKGPGGLLVPAGAGHGHVQSWQEAAAYLSPGVGASHKGHLVPQHEPVSLQAPQLHDPLVHQHLLLVQQPPALILEIELLARRDAAAEGQQLPELLAVEPAGVLLPVHEPAPVHLQQIQQHLALALGPHGNAPLRQLFQGLPHVLRRPGVPVAHYAPGPSYGPDLEAVGHRIELSVDLRRLQHPDHQVLPADLRVLVDPGPQILQQALCAPLDHGHRPPRGEDIRDAPRPDLREQPGHAAGCVPVAGLSVVRHGDHVLRVGPVKLQDRRPFCGVQVKGGIGQHLLLRQGGGLHRREDAHLSLGAVLPHLTACHRQPAVRQEGTKRDGLPVDPGVQEAQQPLPLAGFSVLSRPPGPQLFTRRVVKQRVFIPGVDTGPGRQGIRLPPALCFLIDDPQAVTVLITGPVRIREPYPSIAEQGQAA